MSKFRLSIIHAYCTTKQTDKMGRHICVLGNLIKMKDKTFDFLSSKELHAENSDLGL